MPTPTQLPAFKLSTSQHMGNQLLAMLQTIYDSADAYGITEVRLATPKRADKDCIQGINYKTRIDGDSNRPRDYSVFYRTGDNKLKKSQHDVGNNLTVALYRGQLTIATTTGGEYRVELSPVDDDAMKRVERDEARQLRDIDHCNRSIVDFARSLREAMPLVGPPPPAEVPIAVTDDTIRAVLSTTDRRNSSANAATSHPFVAIISRCLPFADASPADPDMAEFTRLLDSIGPARPKDRNCGSADPHCTPI